ncbi:GNAT family N-acetyltransferase [Petroclostridium sp. X23]|uniref:GNAT family N-acetyltransferase n=1 Tax=Petroclostridium sp. X23 TaxID=3045146 RepID=UPI0024AE466D|nr:GNAT family N-acetyltransferase [Petroclostridium sp. X23]WHH61082.1 GNAT family N-acetyltransferase [Petroclostridium sp. X23]
MITTKWLTGEQDLSHPYYIRTEVFIKEQHVPQNIEIDQLDKTAHHVVVYEKNTPVATGRLVIANQQYLLGRIAVLKEHRGKKLGDLVVRMLIRKAFDLGAQEVHIHAQTQAQAFYEKLGFIPYGKIYTEAGIAHINMVKKEDVKGNCC